MIRQSQLVSVNDYVEGESRFELLGRDQTGYKLFSRVTGREQGQNITKSLLVLVLKLKYMGECGVPSATPFSYIL